MGKEIIELAKQLGEINQRLKTLESLVYNNFEDEDKSQENPPHRVTYPVVGNVISEKPLSNDQFRMIKNSMCKIQIAGDFVGTGTVVMETEMTRDELDDYIAKNPGLYGEYILKITPAYEEYL
jgi:hypothetical protein